MMLPTKIHLAISRGIAGLTWLDHLLKARRLIAVKASVTYEAARMVERIHSQANESGVRHEVDVKSVRVYRSQHTIN
jgi:hypothetical protein